jgi:proteasome lid subunit RPN8/RPN11
MAVKIDKIHFDLIQAYGEEAYPDECCGFLLGNVRNGSKDVLATMPAFNSQTADEKYHRFLITSEAYLQCEKFAKERGLDIVGFYHSHPNAEARPSAYDVEHGWPWYSYVIISVKNNKAADVTSWVLEDDRSQFKPENIIIINNEENG